MLNTVAMQGHCSSATAENLRGWLWHSNIHKCKQLLVR